jgi:hypothetical protein
MVVVCIRRRVALARRVRSKVRSPIAGKLCLPCQVAHSNESSRSGCGTAGGVDSESTMWIAGISLRTYVNHPEHPENTSLTSTEAGCEIMRLYWKWDVQE